MWSITKTGHLKKVTKNEIVQGDFNFLILVYPAMKELFDLLFDSLQDNQIPLLIGGDYPGWAKAYIEKRLRKPTQEGIKI